MIFGRFEKPFCDWLCHFDAEFPKRLYILYTVSSAFTRHNASAYNVESSRTFLVSVAPTTGE